MSESNTTKAPTWKVILPLGQTILTLARVQVDLAGRNPALKLAKCMVFKTLYPYSCICKLLQS